MWAALGSTLTLVPNSCPWIPIFLRGLPIFHLQEGNEQNQITNEGLEGIGPSLCGKLWDLRSLIYGLRMASHTTRITGHNFYWCLWINKEKPNHSCIDRLATLMMPSHPMWMLNIECMWVGPRPNNWVIIKEGEVHSPVQALACSLIFFSFTNPGKLIRTMRSETSAHLNLLANSWLTGNQHALLSCPRGCPTGGWTVPLESAARGCVCWGPWIERWVRYGL